MDGLLESVKAQNEKLDKMVQNPWLYALSLVIRIALVLVFLYFFLVALGIMGGAFQAVGGKDSGSLFTSINNPIAGLMVGVLSTVLVQSSSTTTSIVVTAVGAGVLTVQAGVPIIFGANIGTTVTNTIVSMGFANEAENYERAFAGATVHDMFNFLGVIVWLPIDLIWVAADGTNGLFASFAKLLVPTDTESDSSLSFNFFVKEWTEAISKAVIDTNRGIISDYAHGQPTYDECGTLDAAGKTIVAYKMVDSSACIDPVLPYGYLGGVYSFDAYTDGATTKKPYKCSCNSADVSRNYSQLLNDFYDADSSKTPGTRDAYFGLQSIFTSANREAIENGEDIDCSISNIQFDFCKNYSDIPGFASDYGLTAAEYQDRVFQAVTLFYNKGRVVRGGSLFNDGYNDTAIGIIGLIVSLVMLIVSLLGIVKVMQTIVAGPAEKYIVRGLNYDFPGGGYLAIVMGALITIFVQSSSITTSILTPMVAIGSMTLESMYPFTIGANLGTTVTGLLAGLASGRAVGIQMALCHTFFNIFNGLLWYPIPFMRNIPLNAARFLGTMAAAYKIFPLVYILVAFVIYPLFFLGISVLLGNGDAGGVAGGVILLLIFLMSHGIFLYWYQVKGGKEKVKENVEKRAEANKEKRRVAAAAVATGKLDV